MARCQNEMPGTPGSDHSLCPSSPKSGLLRARTSAHSSVENIALIPQIWPSRRVEKDLNPWGSSVTSPSGGDTVRPSPKLPLSPTVGAHGRSEIWSRRATVRTLRLELERLGARLRAIRVERRLSIETAAEKAGLDETSVGRLERGQTNVTFGVLVALAIVYRITVDDIFRDHPLQAVNPRPVKKTAAARRLNVRRGN